MQKSVPDFVTAMFWDLGKLYSCKNLCREGRPEHGHIVVSQMITSYLQGVKGAGLFSLVKRRLRSKLLSFSTQRRSLLKMVAHSRARGSDSKLQLGRLGLNIHLLVRHHSSRSSERERCSCCLSVLPGQSHSPRDLLLARFQQEPGLKSS